MSSFAKVHATNGQNLTLQVDTINHDVVKSLLDLTWYHNDTLLVPGQDTRVSLSRDNKTLMITDFTSTYAGIYKAQFNQLFVHPYNEDCKNEFLSLMRNHHILKPAIFCVNIKENDCSDREVPQNQVSLSLQNSSIQGALPQNLSLKVIGVVSNSKILKHSLFAWYRSGQQLAITSSSRPKHYNNLSFSDEFHLSNTSYEHTGRYEVLLRLGLRTYFEDCGCRSYYDRFVAPYLHPWMTIAKEYTDIYYYRGAEP